MFRFLNKIINKLFRKEIIIINLKDYYWDYRPIEPDNGGTIIEPKEIKWIKTK